MTDKEIEKIIEVQMSEVVGVGLEYFLDLISERIGYLCLSSPDYEIIGFRQPYNVLILRVTGVLENELEESEKGR